MIKNLPVFKSYELRSSLKICFNSAFHFVYILCLTRNKHNIKLTSGMNSFTHRDRSCSLA